MLRVGGLSGMCASALTLLCLAAPGAPALGRADAATLPPELISLEQRMGELQITSLRFSGQTELTGVSRKEKQLLTLLSGGGKTSGEVTTNPPAATVSLDFLGLQLTVRTIGTTVYVRIAQLAPLDGGKPWVKLGPGGLGELFSVTDEGHPVKKPPAKPEPPPTAPSIAQPPFASLVKLLAGAREVRALGPGTVEGQPVQRFLAVLTPAQFKPATVGAVTASAARRRAPKTTATLEVALAPNGLPVSTVLAVHADPITTTVTLKIPAVDFPLVIEAPPAAETISAAELKELEKQKEARMRHRAHKKRRLPRTSVGF